MKELNECIVLATGEVAELNQIIAELGKVGSPNFMPEDQPALADVVDWVAQMQHLKKKLNETLNIAAYALGRVANFDNGKTGRVAGDQYIARVKKRSAITYNKGPLLEAWNHPDESVRTAARQLLNPDPRVDKRMLNQIMKTHTDSSGAMARAVALIQSAARENNPPPEVAIEVPSK